MLASPRSIACALLSFAAALFGLACARVDGGREVRALTGAPTRLTWVQDHGGGGDVFAEESNLILMGFDTEDGRGERVILSEPSNYSKPLLTRDGRRIVFSNKIENRIYRVDFDGRNRKRLADGFAIDVWNDPATGADWVYAKAAYDKLRGKNDPIFRFRFDAPDRRETVWDATATDVDSFQVSADGTRAAGMFPWAHAGIADLTARRWRKFGDGCWTSLSPDNSYIAWVFDGPHRNVMMFDSSSSRSWSVCINQAERIEGYEVYHPRWSNHPRFMVMTGPYKVGGGGNRILAGGEGVEVYIGRFGPELTSVEEWVRVSDNRKADFYPDAWVEGGEAVSVADAMAAHRDKLIEQVAPTEAAGVRVDAWPLRMDGLVFLWENGRSANQILDAEGSMVRSCRVRLRGGARFGRFHDLDLESGAALAADVDDALLQACRASNQLTVEVLVTAEKPTQAGPARIVTFSSSASSRNFTLGQEGDEFVLRLRTTGTGPNGLPPQVALCKVEAGRPTHLVVTYAPGLLAAYRDGKEVLTSAAVQGDFSNWEPHSLLLGDEQDGGRDWAGRAECVAVYNRFVRPEEAAARFAALARRLRDRTPVVRVELEAELLEKTVAPDPQDLGEYPRTLVVYRYRLAADGALGARGTEVLAAHWAILDRRTVPDIVDRVTGRLYKLDLEPFDRHPQLASERRFDTTDTLDLPLFYDQAGRARFAAGQRP